jgi:hypothetical protein
MSVRRDRSGGDRLTVALRDIDGLVGKTGYFETAKYPDGTPVAYVATIHEYGAAGQGIPARPTMRPTAADKRTEWAGLMAKGARDALNGKMTSRDALERLTLRAAGDVSKAISALQTPALSPRTIARKGFDKPLVDTGLMLRSVTGVVEPKGSQ